MKDNDLIKLNKETYNKIAHLFAETRKYLWDDLKPLQKYTKDGFRVLDLGCGSGRLYHLFQDFQPLDKARGKGVEYIGLDQSEEQIKIAKQKFPNIDFRVGEMTTLPFVDNEFDVLYCIATFHHLPDEESRIKSLQEMKRVLKSGSYILMTNWNMYSKTAQKLVENGKFNEFKPGDFLIPWMNSEREVLGERYYHGFILEELENLFKKTGLHVEDQYYTTKGVAGSKTNPGNIVSIIKKAGEAGKA
ncbi:MAG: methyltransferase domain-containing protein [Candidatus Magasanikiibacteriota bacterium]